MNLVLIGLIAPQEAEVVGRAFLGTEEGPKPPAPYRPAKPCVPCLLGESDGISVYVMACRYPWLVSRVGADMRKIFGPAPFTMEVIAIPVRGQKLTAMLYSLARLPLAGSTFRYLADRRVAARTERLAALGRQLRFLADRAVLAVPENLAAKPFLCSSKVLRSLNHMGDNEGANEGDEQWVKQ